MKMGEVATVVTMMGEVVGRLKDETAQGYIIEDPRLFVPAREGNSGGFAPGVCMTGKQNLEQAHFNRAVVLCVVPAHPEIEAGWREAVTGLVS